MMIQSPHPFVRFVNVRKTYDGETLVVKDLHLSVQKGEFLSLLGPSGSGKTTCLMMLAGFETVTSGEIHVDGRALHTVPPHRRNIGMVFQNYALFKHMSVIENVSFALKMRRVPKDEIATRARRALAMVQLDGLEDRMPSQLSGGQQQRAAVARAVVFEPQIILMDEPLGALDKQLREQLQLEIKQLHRQLGVTVIYVTHDQSEALTMSDRIAVFHQGEIQQLDTPQRLYAEPRNSFVASFIGENNLLPARVIQMEKGQFTAEIERGIRLTGVATTSRFAGATITVSVRPERIALRQPDRTYPNSVDGIVEDMVYHGDHVRCWARLPGGARLLVKLADDHGAAVLRPGAAATFGWDAADCRALDDVA
jgi:putative spermidine/putrescine transport system ATP-binding protein